ncbi:hypothetical protein BJ742DRAFT_777886 [Cladochytrium replicatum]|nr:hypothetical protein BJ742DRAFT_777886 [Cladochytrium replicatum]
MGTTIDTQVNLLASDLFQLRDRFQSGSATLVRISSPPTYSNNTPPPPWDYHNTSPPTQPSSVLSLDRANPTPAPDRSFDRISAPPGPRSSPFRFSHSPISRKLPQALVVCGQRPRSLLERSVPILRLPARTGNEAKLLKQVETIEHALFDCPSSRHFWANLSAFLPIVLPGFGCEGYKIALADVVFFFPALRTGMNRNDVHALVIHSVALWALWGSRGAGTGGGASPGPAIWITNHSSRYLFDQTLQFARISLEFEEALVSAQHSAAGLPQQPENGRPVACAELESERVDPRRGRVWQLVALRALFATISLSNASR